jgi:amino acid adenylation domain-containing protein/FkbM family methyltransferase
LNAIGIPFLAIDMIDDRIAQYAPGNLTVRAFPENLAYVMYTSGSTGLPKGVAVEHRNLASYITAITERLNLRAGISLAAMSAPTADLGYTATFPALATGGCLHIIPEELFLDGDGFADYLEQRHVDCLKIVPSHLAALQASAAPRAVMPRRALVLGGEASSAKWSRSLCEGFPLVSIVNHYGPTETTVGVSTLTASDGFLEARSRTLPIGRPLAHARSYLLSADLEPVPIGAKGDLYIAGRCVSRGYLGSAGATAEKFIPDHLSGDFGSRMYCSNDVGRYLADGTIEFLGRSDDQLKVSGYRIEPKEIEHALLGHPDIYQAAVLSRKRVAHSEAAELAAYVVAKPARARSIGGRARYTLPNGMAIASINKNETDYVYREIFQLRAYQRFGIHIGDGSTVLDVGANIGLFSLWVSQLCPSADVFAFEPNPRVFEVLKINASLYAGHAHLFNFGLGNRERMADFTYFPGFTLFSGLHAAPETEKNVVRHFIVNDGTLGTPELIEASEELLNQRFESERFPVTLRTLSDVIDENGIDHIHLLKVNVEKSELEVLEGITPDHWARIDQIVLEVDLSGNLSEITGMLEERDYQVNVMQDKALEGTELFYVYAQRAGCAQVRNDGIAEAELFSDLQSPFLTPGEVEVFLAQRLPGYMVPRTIVILDAMPITPSGKVDRAALQDADGDNGRGGTRLVPPGNSMERAIASVWREILGVKTIGVNENFFNCGGNSLLLAHVCGRLRRDLDRAITVMELFKYPTIHTLARHLCDDSDPVASGSPEHKRGLDRRRAAALRNYRIEPTEN